MNISSDKKHLLEKIFFCILLYRIAVLFAHAGSSWKIFNLLTLWKWNYFADIILSNEVRQFKPHIEKRRYLTLLMQNTTCSVLANNVDPDLLASEEANWSGSALSVISYVNFYQKPGSSNLVNWKLEMGVAS